MSVDPKKLLIVANFVAIRREGKILLLQRRADEILAGGAWALPGGKSERGESCFDAIRREIREETGLEISGEPRFLAHRAWPRRDDWVMGFYWLADAPEGEVRLSPEHTGAAWIGPDEIEKATEFDRPALRAAFEK